MTCVYGDEVCERRKVMIRHIYGSIDMFPGVLSELVTDYAFNLPYEFVHSSKDVFALQLYKYESRFPIGISPSIFTVQINPPEDGWGSLHWGARWFVGIMSKTAPYHCYRISDGGRLLTPGIVDLQWIDPYLPNPDASMLKNWQHYPARSAVTVSLEFHFNSRQVSFMFYCDNFRSYAVTLALNTMLSTQQLELFRPYVEVWDPSAQVILLPADTTHQPNEKLIVISPKPILIDPKKATTMSEERRNGTSIRLCIQEVSGCSEVKFYLTVESSNTIAELRQMIADRKQVNSDLVGRLVFAGKQLDNDNNFTLAHYNIPDNATIHLIGRLRGS